MGLLTRFMSDLPPTTNPLPEVPADPRSLQGDRQSWRSEELLGERTEVLIVHGSEVYRLRRTRQDKLILYK